MSRPAQHMLAVERAILERWLPLHDIVGVHEYDVHLPTPEPEWPAHYSEADKEEWRWLTMKRVDLLIRAAGARWVIEVTPRVSTRALGALALYKSILEREEGVSPPIVLGVIAEAGDPAVEQLCRDQGVKVWVV